METQTQNINYLMQKDNYVFKFVVLGDSNVGKTSILHHFIFNKCKEIIMKR